MIPTLVSAHSEVTLDTAEIFVYTHTLLHLFYVDQVMCRCSECKFYLLTVLLQEIKVFQDVTLCHWRAVPGIFRVMMPPSSGT